MAKAKAKAKTKTKAMAKGVATAAVPELGDVVQASDGRLFFIPVGGTPRQLPQTDLTTIVDLIRNDAALLRALLSKRPGIIAAKR